MRFHTPFLLASLLFLAACTFSIIVMDTHGSASDMVDENQSANPSVSVPVK